MEIVPLKLDSIRRMHKNLFIVQRLCDQIQVRDERIASLEYVLRKIVTRQRVPKNLAQPSEDIDAVELEIKLPIKLLRLGKELIQNVDEQA